MFAFGITDVFAHFYDLSALRISASCQFKSELRDITISDFSCVESAACVCVLKFSTILIKSFTKKNYTCSENVKHVRINFGRQNFSRIFCEFFKLCVVVFSYRDRLHFHSCKNWCFRSIPQSNTQMIKDDILNGLRRKKKKIQTHFISTKIYAEKWE